MSSINKYQFPVLRLQQSLQYAGHTLRESPGFQDVNQQVSIYSLQAPAITSVRWSHLACITGHHYTINHQVAKRYSLRVPSVPQVAISRLSPVIHLQSTINLKATTASLSKSKCRGVHPSWPLASCSLPVLYSCLECDVVVLRLNVDCGWMTGESLEIAT